jgi:uncharacterized membrane protein
MAVGQLGHPRYRDHMETWRVIACCLLTLAGLVLVMVAMAQVRDRKGSTRQEVTRTGLIALGVLALLVVIVATIANQTVGWALVAASIGIVVFLTMVN